MIEFSEVLPIQEIPAFPPEQYATALSFCALEGAAKITNHISEVTRQRVRKNLTFVLKMDPKRDIAFPTWTYSMSEIPELNEMHDAVQTDINKWKYLDPILVPAREPDDEFIGHLDAASPVGITALSHIEGPTALFIASEHVYSIRNNVFTESATRPPKFLAEFGLGETILIRQRIDTLNGQQVNLPQMIHEGIADQDRKVLALDFRSAHLWLPPIALAA